MFEEIHNDGGKDRAEDKPVQDDNGSLLVDFAISLRIVKAAMKEFERRRKS